MTNKDIKNAYVGTTPVKAMYLGSTKVYPTIANGVYILDVDNKLFKKDKWDIENNSKAMGVAVITDNCAFCIQIIEDGGLYPFTTDGHLIDEFPSVVTTTDEEVALKDFKGYSNSETIISNAWDRIYEAIFAVFVEWPNGNTAGYIGALGEWQELYQHIDEVNEYLALIEGDPVDGYYWSSTLGDTESVWAFVGHINSPHLFGGDRVPTDHVSQIRSFYPIDLSKVTVVQ